MLAEGLIVGTREALLFNTSQYFSEFILLIISPPVRVSKELMPVGKPAPLQFLEVELKYFLWSSFPRSRPL